MPRKLLILASAALCMGAAGAAAAQVSGDATTRKDPIVIQTPHGGRVEIKAPHDSITVRQIGPREYVVHINSTKNIEAKVLPRSNRDPR